MQICRDFASDTTNIYAKQTLNALHMIMYMINRGKCSEEIESHLVGNDHCYHCTNQLVGKNLRIVAQ